MSRQEDTAERWRRIAAVVEMALGLERPLREAYLAQLAASDEDLVRRVRAHLRRHETAPDEVPDSEIDENDSVRVRRPDRVGPYRILHRIGQGGMGQVFLAQRSDGEFERNVAIKIIGTGFDLPIVHQRFLSERQILAGFDHPYIARLYDAGTTEDGRPYLVMEAIEGRPIDRYCAEEGLSLEERLRLFRRVCEAVEHAHRRLVVHRDLKPSNILVTADGTPKLLDFGIAKLLDPDAFPLPLDEVTRTAMRPLTPRWASPEQVRGGSITTASDVWTLGVLLHRLLTGGHPHEPESTEPDALLQALEKPPEAASKTLRRRLAAGDEVPWPELEARRLVRRLEGDLDAIVGRALRVEPDERYASVSALDDDLRRLLDGEPVRATRSTVVYRLGKFFRRYRTGVLATAAILLFALGFALVSQRQSAEIAEQAARAERTRDFLADLLGAADERVRRQGDVGLHQILREGVLRVDDVGAGDPLVQLRLYATLSEAQLNVGAAGDALRTLQAGLDALRACVRCDDRELEFAEELVIEGMSSDLEVARSLVPRLEEQGLIDAAAADRLRRKIHFIEGDLDDLGHFASDEVISISALVDLPGELHGLGVLSTAVPVLQKLLGEACSRPGSADCAILLHYAALFFADGLLWADCADATEKAIELRVEHEHRYDPRLVFGILTRGRCASTLPEAQLWIDEALEATRARFEVDPSSSRARFQRGLAPLHLAMVAERQGDAEAQARHAAEAVAFFKPFHEAQEIVFVDSAYASALLLAGRAEEARGLVARLIERGWRPSDLLRRAREAGVLPADIEPPPDLETVIAPEVLAWIRSLPTPVALDPELAEIIDRLSALERPAAVAREPWRTASRTRSSSPREVGAARTGAGAG